MEAPCTEISETNNFRKKMITHTHTERKTHTQRERERERERNRGVTVSYQLKRLSSGAIGDVEHMVRRVGGYGHGDGGVLEPWGRGSNDGQ